MCFLLSILLAPALAAVVATAWALGSNDNRDFDGGGDLKANDLVLIRGRWVYDAGHKGWNELHPVKRIQKIPDQDACRWATFDDLKKRWCDEVDNPHHPERRGRTARRRHLVQKQTWDLQRQPKHRWFFHPLVDGCEPPVEDPTIRSNPCGRVRVAPRRAARESPVTATPRRAHPRRRRDGSAPAAY